jgi:hypothetical protein
MTHPLYAAIDAAIAQHGWPDDAKHIGINCPALEPHRFSVTLGKFGDPANSFMGVSDTLANAAAMAHEQQSMKPLRFTPVVVGGVA